MKPPRWTTCALCGRAVVEASRASDGTAGTFESVDGKHRPGSWEIDERGARPYRPGTTDDYAWGVWMPHWSRCKGRQLTLTDTVQPERGDHGRIPGGRGRSGTAAAGRTGEGARNHDDPEVPPGTGRLPGSAEPGGRHAGGNAPGAPASPGRP